MGGAHQPNIDGYFFLFPDRTHGLFLNDAQQFDLNG
jgi:hypothetical protein